MRPIKLYILDDTLKNTFGHYFEYDKSIFDASSSFNVVCKVLSNTKIEKEILDGWDVVPTFRYDVAKNLGAINFIFSNLVFFFDLLRSTPLKSIDSESYLFIPNSRYFILFGFVVWLRTLKDVKRPNVILLFRYKFRPFLLKGVIKFISLNDKHRKIKFVTDSELLADEYKSATNHDFYVLPIPHTLSQPVIATEPLVSNRNAKLTIAFLGAPRLEKGIDVLVDSIPYLKNLLLEEAIQLIIQGNPAKNDLEIIPVIQKLNLFGKMYPGVTVLSNSLSERQYYDLLSSADIIAIPYRQEPYRSRTSGPFAEALSLGKPVVVTQDTWMSLQQLSFGSGTTFSDNDPEDLANSIKKLVNNYLVYAEQAKDRMTMWKEKHNAYNFCKSLLNLYGNNLNRQ